MANIPWVTKEEIDTRVPELTEDQKKIEALIKDNADLRDMVNFVIINY